MKLTVILVFFGLLSFNVATAAALETATKQEAGKPAASQPAAAQSAEEPSVSLDFPLFSSISQDVPIASVDDQIITLQELNEALSSLHESSKEDTTKMVAKIDYKTIVDRLVNTTLVDMEAKDMDLDKLPEVQDAVTSNADNTLRNMLIDKETKDLVPDKKAVEDYYKAATREFKIKSVIFTKEEDAKKMAAALKSGKDFDALVKSALTDKTAKGGEEGQYIRLDKLLPEVAVEVEKLKAGGVSPVIKVKEGFTLIKVEGIRYPEDTNAKKEAEKQALLDKKKAFLVKYFTGLKKKYAVIDKKLYKSLDFEKSEAEFSKLLDDKRPLVKIKGEKSITVGQYTEIIDSKFYHGIKRSIQEKRVNERKDSVLDEMLYNRLFLKEARALGIDKTAAYINSQSRFKRSVIFGVFIQKAVIPDIKVTEGESRKYYEDHIADYTVPEMMKLYSLGFYKVKDAEDTLKKLQRGDDFKWLKSNASGQLKENEPGALSLNGDVFTVTGLDEGLRKALTGVKTGDYRLYSDSKFSYVINVREDIPSQKQDYVKAREETARKVFSEKVNQSVLDWADKLRQAHKVRVYITGMSTTKPE